MRILIFTFLFLNFCLSAYCADNCNYINYNLGFFEKFNDKYFENYIQLALQNNHELKQAQQVLEQYRWEVKNSLSKELPSASVGSNYLGTHFPRNDRNFFVKNNSYILPLRASYEPDFLLKNRDKTKAEQKIYKAQCSKTDSIYISLLTDVASCYVNLILNDFLIEKQQNIIQNETKNLALNNLKFKRGILEKEILNKEESSLVEQKNVLDNFEKTRNTVLCSLALLTGQSADNIGEFKRGRIEDFEYTETIPEIINSDLIYNRPDLIEAQNLLKSAKIDVTVAKKEFFPSFNITGFLIFDTVGPGNFFSWSSSFAFLAAGLTQDIFKGGEKIANLKIKKARFYELMEKYAQIDLNAIKEVNNILFLIKQDKSTEQNSIKNATLALNNVYLSNKKLSQGVISNIELIQEKTSLENKKQALMNSKAQRLIDYFTLYKVLGGQL